MSKSNRENVMRSSATGRSSGRAPRRTRQPAARSISRRKSRRKNSNEYKRRLPYLSASYSMALKILAERITDRRDKALLWVLVDSELRPTEMVSLSRGQIRIRIEKQKDKSFKASGTGCLTRTSTEPVRKFRIGPEAVEALRDYLNSDRVRGDHPALFTERPGQRMTIHTLMPMIDDWIRQAQAKDKAD